jgi:transportin-1
MWIPKEAEYKELVKIFTDSKGTDNTKHLEIFQKINSYSSSSKDFSNYLVYILNDESLSPDIRQISGMTLKGIMERSFSTFSDESVQYFKDNITKCYLHKSHPIRKTISNLINAFIKQGQLELWPEILEFLYSNLDNNLTVNMSLETLILIIEDSGTDLEERSPAYIEKITAKLINFLFIMGKSSPIERNEQLVNLVLTTIHVLIENCSNHLSSEFQAIAKVIIPLSDSQNLQMRGNLGKIWIALVRLENEIVIKHREHLFEFFCNNLTVENYELNFISSEFFNFLVEEESENLLANEQISNSLKMSIQLTLPYVLQYMKLTPNDISGMENKNKKEDKDNREGSTLELEDLEEIEEVKDVEGYNTNWTLRKCCSKLLDKLSSIYPDEVYAYIKPYLETDMQNTDWLVKERSILALGAVGIGCYNLLKVHLSVLITFLIRELHHPNKLVRAIACWTVSRFTKFILIENLAENANQTFVECLSEILKKFLDTEVIVQEAACTAFSSMVAVKKEKMEEYLADIFKIITNAFDKYSSSSMLTLYDIIQLMTEQFEEHFKVPELVDDLIVRIVKAWYTMVKNQDFKNISPLFDVVCSIIRSSGEMLKPYFEYFLNGALVIIEHNIKLYKQNNNEVVQLDKEILSKCLDLLSVLCQSLPKCVKDNTNKIKIVDYIFKIIETDDQYLRHYTIALIGDLAKVDLNIFKSKFDKVVQILLSGMEIQSQNQALEMDKLSVCNNSVWTAGLLGVLYPDQIRLHVIDIIKKLLYIICLPRVFIYFKNKYYS